MSALDRPSEVLLLAVFHKAERAEAAARAFLHSGLDADHVAILAREFRGAALEAVPRSACLEMSGVGRAVARGALAVELGHASAAPGMTQLVGALRRLGLSVTDASCLACAVRADLVLLLAAVPREEAVGWGRLLEGAGAVALTARPRLRRWPPAPTVVVGRQPGTTGSVAPLRPSRRLRREPEAGPWWDGTAP